MGENPVRRHPDTENPGVALARADTVPWKEHDGFLVGWGHTEQFETVVLHLGWARYAPHLRRIEQDQSRLVIAIIDAAEQ
jgi:hypothetical protein